MTEADTLSGVSVVIPTNWLEVVIPVAMLIGKTRRVPQGVESLAQDTQRKIDTMMLTTWLDRPRV